MYSQTQTTFRRYRFDSFEVDSRTGVLRQDGSTVPLQDIPFRFLAALLEHPGELRSRDELRVEIWPAGMNLDFEGALRTAAHKVRQALGDSSQLPRYIETIPGRGFRFVGQVAVESGEPEPPQAPVEARSPGRSRNRFPVWTTTALLAGLGAVALLNGRPWAGRTGRHLPALAPCVVALPTKVLGAPDSAFLTDAVPDTLSTLLAKEEGLDTKVPPTSSQVEKIHGDVAKIAEAYRADFLILTTVTTERDHLLLNVKLAEASTQKVRWASQYEATRDNYNGLLCDAAQALTAVMKPGAAVPPASDSIVELALREGRHFQRQFESSRDSHDFDLALAAFRKAQSLDSSNMLAANAIDALTGSRRELTGDARAAREMPRGPEQGTASPSKTPFRETSEVELALLEGRHYMGRFDIHSQPGDFDRARNAFQRALKANPSCAPALGNLAYLMILKSWAEGPEKEGVSKVEAERLAWRALDLDPRTARAWAALAQSGSSKRPLPIEKTLEYALKAANPKFHQPDHGGNLAGTAGGSIFMVAAGRKIFETNPLAVADAAMAAVGLISMGKAEDALRLMDRALRVEPSFRFGLVAKSAALVALGRLEEARDFLKRCAPPDPDHTWEASLWRQIRFQLAVAQNDKATAAALADQIPMDDGNAVYHLPAGLLWLGRREEALRRFEACPPSAEFGILDTPGIQALRGNPRFERVVEKHRKSATLALRMIEDARARGELPTHLEGTVVQLRALLEKAR
jgi:DNA-binding winged helix-turn-helix (wHTH) protein/tetratricopeptide (TPR) repeat protein